MARHALPSPRPVAAPFLRVLLLLALGCSAPAHGQQLRGSTLMGSTSTNTNTSSSSSSSSAGAISVQGSLGRLDAQDMLPLRRPSISAMSWQQRGKAAPGGRGMPLNGQEAKGNGTGAAHGSSLALASAGAAAAASEAAAAASEEAEAAAAASEEAGAATRLLMRSLSTQTPASTCADLTNCTRFPPRFCAPKWLWRGRPVGNYWCQEFCNKCQPAEGGGGGGGGGSGGGQASCTGDQCQQNRALLALVNKMRKGINKKAMCLSNKLTLAAKAHSEDMQRNKFFDHQGSDGSLPWDRVDRVKFIWGGVAENIAQGYRSVNDVYKGWFGSKGHRENMQGNYKFMGAYKTGPYWTQVFANADEEACNA